MARCPTARSRHVLWIRHRSPRPEQAEPGRGTPTSRRSRLARFRWRRERSTANGSPLRLTLILPNTSGIRRQMSLLIQEQLRQIGIALEIQQMEFPVWNERRTAGKFDIDFTATTQDPSPSGLTQSWTCTGGGNVAQYCNRGSGFLMEQAQCSGRGSRAQWVAGAQQIEADAPATFLYAPTYVYAVKPSVSKCDDHTGILLASAA